jgi:hypothetical protein
MRFSLSTLQNQNATPAPLQRNQHPLAHAPRTSPAIAAILTALQLERKHCVTSRTDSDPPDPFAGGLFSALSSSSRCAKQQPNLSPISRLQHQSNVDWGAQTRH